MTPVGTKGKEQPQELHRLPLATSPLQREPAKEVEQAAGRGTVLLQRGAIPDPPSTCQELAQGISEPSACCSQQLHPSSLQKSAESLNLSHSSQDSPPPVDQDQAESWKPNRDVALKCLLTAPTQSSSAFPVLEMIAGG